jgi:ribosomal protein S18 acetylase RimI-like enzyme
VRGAGTAADIGAAVVDAAEIGAAFVDVADIGAAGEIGATGFRWPGIVTERYLRGVTVLGVSNSTSAGERAAVQVRVAGPADAGAIAKVHVASWQWAYVDQIPASHLATLANTLPERTARWHKGLSRVQNDTRTFVAVTDSPGEASVVGFAMAGRYRHQQRADDLADGIGEIYAIYLDYSVASTGVGRALMDSAVGWLRDAGLDPIRLWVLESNTRARSFYHRYGFRVDGGRADFTVEPAGGPPVVVPEIRLALSLGD